MFPAVVIIQPDKDGGIDHVEEATSVHNVEFEDFLVERCIRETLGKDWDEDVTKEELSSVKGLTISWEKDITLGLDFASCNRAYGGYVNLADLKYLTGLEELQLDFYPKSILLENMDAIANCRQLRNLSMPLQLRGYNYSNGYMGKGYRYLKDIFAQLPALEMVDFGVTVPGQLQELLQPDEPERKIVFAENEESIYDWMMIWDDGHKWPANENVIAEQGVAVISLDDLMHAAEMKEGAERDEYEEDALQLEDLIVLVGKETFDCEMLADFRNIKTLTIVGMSSVLKPPASQVIHLEALAELPCLGALSLYNLETDLAGLAEFSSLRELYLTYCSSKETFGLQRLPLLRELSIIGISDEKWISDQKWIHVSWPKLWENMPELRYFNGNFMGVDKESIPDIFADGKGAAKLESLVLGCTGGLDDDAFMNGILEQMPEDLTLKTLFLFVNSKQRAISLDQVKCNSSLENFFCNSQVEHIAEFINTAYLNNVRGSVDLMSLYKAGIYDDRLQAGAFTRDVDIEDYYRDEWTLH